jgi:hypothetical protein
MARTLVVEGEARESAPTSANPAGSKRNSSGTLPLERGATAVAR